MSEFSNIEDYPFDSENEYFLEKYCAVVFEFDLSEKNRHHLSMREIYIEMLVNQAIYPYEKLYSLAKYLNNRMPRTRILNERIKSFKEDIFFAGTRTSEESTINKLASLGFKSKGFESNHAPGRFMRRTYILKTIHIGDFIEIVSRDIEENEIYNIPVVNKILNMTHYENRDIIKAITNHFSFNYVTIELKHLFELS